MKTNAARVLIAEDHDKVREGTRKTIEEPDVIKVVAMAKTGHEAYEMAQEHNPDLVLMDVRMPDWDGLEATRRIKTRMPHIPIIMHTAHEDINYILEAIRAGAAGYLLKETPAGQIRACIKAAIAGDEVLPTELAMKLLRRFANEPLPMRGAHAPPRPLLNFEELENLLTRQERNHLKLIASGNSNKDIAAKLHISIFTVKGHVSSLITKMGVSDRTQAAVKAVQAGMVPTT